MKKKRNPHVGSTFEDFLKEQGLLEDATSLAIKQVLAWQLRRAMKSAGVSQSELARRMNTSRAVVQRLLNGDDVSVTLSTISRAAIALGKDVSLRLTP